jgi:hypothetical protein
MWAPELMGSRSRNRANNLAEASDVRRERCGEIFKQEDETSGAVSEGTMGWSNPKSVETRIVRLSKEIARIEGFLYDHANESDRFGAG